MSRFTHNVLLSTYDVNDVILDIEQHLDIVRKLPLIQRASYDERSRKCTIVSTWSAYTANRDKLERVREQMGFDEDYSSERVIRLIICAYCGVESPCCVADNRNILGRIREQMGFDEDYSLEAVASLIIRDYCESGPPVLK